MKKPSTRKEKAPMGGCFMTDRVAVDGLEIGYMYREEPTRPEDSGWRFFSGDESQEYIDDLTHTHVYDVNTAANCDPDIIPYLDTLPPCAFEKVPGAHEYQRVEDPPLDDSEFPVVGGRHQLTDNWAVIFPRQFKHRIEDDSLVFWRPGITVWTTIWRNDDKTSQQERLDSFRSDASPEAFAAEVFSDGDVTRFAYRLTDRGEDGVVHVLHAYAIGVGGNVLMAIYVDDEGDLELARQIWKSLDETP